MTKIGSNRGNRGLGRPKGAANKTTLIAKEAIQAAFDKLGGAKRLVEWVKEDTRNEQIFYGTIYPKLLPLQVTGGTNGEPPVGIEVRFVDAG